MTSDRFVVRGGIGYFYDRQDSCVYNGGATGSIPTWPSIRRSGASNYFSTEAQPYAPTPLGWTPRWVNRATQRTSSNLTMIVTGSISPHQ